MDLVKLALNGIIYEQAVENQGIFPQSIEGGKNSYKKRTDKMEGHNDCVMAITRDVVRFEEFINKNEFKKDIEKALLEEWVSLQANGEENPKLWINCNDLFYWAVSDSEEILPNELVDLFKCYEETESFGGFLWASKKRKMRPQSPWYDSFSKKEKGLFNACGPERNKTDEG